MQTLAFLGIVGVYDPDANLAQVVSMGMRAAASMQLHRKDTIFLSPHVGSVHAQTLERVNDQRKRIFWSLYILDRLIQFVLGLPPCLRDEEIDVEVGLVTTELMVSFLHRPSRTPAPRQWQQHKCDTP